jgi:ElaB/YqjD/DUF883 family membrane-anchored ribosome-binding protein
MENYNSQPYPESTPGSSAATAARMVVEGASNASDKVAELSRTAADKIDSSRESAAGALDKTATSLHAGSDQIANAAHSAADKIQATADYVRNTDLQGMSNDVQDLVKRYPGPALAAAAVLGFLVARGLRGSN